jgi:glycopeptide antibiotics resistance protein
MLLDSKLLWIISIPLWIVLKIVILRSKYVKRVKIRTGYEILNALLFLYMLMLISIKLFPINVNMSDGNYMSYNFIPFSSIHEMQSRGSFWFLRNVLGDIIIFMPFGFLIPLVLNNLKKLIHVTLYGFVLSLIFEIFQSTGFILLRNFDVDDLILNTVGVIGGFILCKIFIAKSSRLKGMTFCSLYSS